MRVDTLRVATLRLLEALRRRRLDLESLDSPVTLVHFGDVPFFGCSCVGVTLGETVGVGVDEELGLERCSGRLEARFIFRIIFEAF